MKQRQGLSHQRGYSLIELMIVLIMIGVLASIALPLYSEHVLQSRRAEGRAAIEEIRNLQYEFFQNYKRYGTRPEIGYPATTDNGHYTILVSNAALLQYTASATAAGKQAKDTDCAVFEVTATGVLQGKNSGGTVNTDCW